MALTSINTNIAAYYAQSNIGKASTNASLSVARLSSGTRIVRAADDVAALSAGTSLRTNVTTLRTALINTSQGSSLLQVADGALSQVTEILQRQKAIAVQAGAGSLGATERAFLNQEFQSLTNEIDRLSQTTNFNGVSLLDGSLSEKVNADTKTTNAAQSTGSITFNLAPTNGQTISLNGTAITFVTSGATGNQVNLASTVQGTIDNLVTFLNSSTTTALNQASYSRTGNSLIITQRAGGALGNTYRVDTAAGTYTNTANAAVVSGAFRERTTSSSAIATTSLAATTTAAGFAAGVITAAFNGAPAVTLYTVTGTESVADLVNGINANSATTGIDAYVTGTTGAYVINLRGSYGTQATPAFAIAGAGLGAVTFTANATQTVFALTGPSKTDGGLGYGRTIGIGTVGNSILNNLKTNAATVRVSFPVIADADLLTTAAFDQTSLKNLVVGGVTFTFTTTSAANKGAAEITVGSTLTETLDNAVNAINSFFGDGAANYALNQIEAFRDGRDIVLRKKDVGDVTDLVAGGTLTAPTVSVTGATVSGDFANGNINGVVTSGVTNADFLGRIQGFNATFTGTANRVNLSIQVGGKTYTANSVNTTVASNTTVRLTSNDGGGYFDIELKANNGTTVNSQADADTFTSRLDGALSSINFFQKRSVSSFTGTGSIVTGSTITGSLLGARLDLQSDSFDGLTIDSVRVTAPVGDSQNGRIVFTINGEEYVSSATIGKNLGANGIYSFTNVNDSNKVLEFRTGGSSIDFSTDERAAAFEKALGIALGSAEGSASLRFQVGVTTEDTLSVTVGNVSTDRLFDGQSIDVLTQDSAAIASTAIDEALDRVTTIRADVGALQSRFNFASNNIESSLQNQDAARGVLLDTDVAAESTAYATAQVQLQAGISVLAQANQLTQSLLKLIG